MKGVPDGIPYYKEPFHEFSRIPYEEGKDLIIDGYFQSEKYFKRSVVLDLYRITDELRKKIWNICGNILEKGETVSIHVRRGDYLKLPHALPFVESHTIRMLFNILVRIKYSLFVVMISIGVKKLYRKKILLHREHYSFTRFIYPILVHSQYYK